MTFNVTDLDVAAQSAGNEPAIVLKPVVHTESTYFVDPVNYTSMNGWVTAIPIDENWPWAAAHPACRWDLDASLDAPLLTLGPVAGGTGCDAASWTTTTTGDGVLQTTYEFKVEVVFCFSELSVAECDDEVYVHGDAPATWEAPAYDMDNTWTSTWWAQVLPGHSMLSVCRRLWQSNALTVTAAINVSNTVGDLVAFSGATVDLSSVNSTVSHSETTADEQPLQLGSAHFEIYAEKRVAEGDYAPIAVKNGKYVMNFEDRHRFTFTLQDQSADGVDVVQAVLDTYDRLDVEYRWMVRDLANDGQWLDANERYAVTSYLYDHVSQGSLVQTENLNVGGAVVRTDRVGTDVTSFAIEDEIATTGLFIEDELQLQITMLWSANYTGRLRRLAAADKTVVSLTIGFLTEKPSADDSRNAVPMIVLSVVFMVGVVGLVAMHKTQVHAYHII